MEWVFSNIHYFPSQYFFDLEEIKFENFKHFSENNIRLVITFIRLPLWQVLLVFAVPAIHQTLRPNCTKVLGQNQFGDPNKPMCFDFSSSNFNVQAGHTKHNCCWGGSYYYYYHYYCYTLGTLQNTQVSKEEKSKKWAALPKSLPSAGRSWRVSRNYTSWVLGF